MHLLLAALLAIPLPDAHPRDIGWLAGRDKHLGDVLGVGDCLNQESSDPDSASSMPLAIIVDDRLEVIGIFNLLLRDSMLPIGCSAQREPVRTVFLVSILRVGCACMQMSSKEWPVH